MQVSTVQPAARPAAISAASLSRSGWSHCDTTVGPTWASGALALARRPSAAETHCSMVCGRAFFRDWAEAVSAVAARASTARTEAVRAFARIAVFLLWVGQSVFRKSVKHNGTASLFRFENATKPNDLGP